MAKKGGYSLGEYQGGYSSLDPNKAYSGAFTGYRAKASTMGASTKPDTANQIQEVNKLINQGMVPIEVSSIQPEVFDQIPKQHFKELNRMAKLTGTKLSVHAPAQIEPSGIGEQGWSENNRELVEKQLSNVVEKASQMSDKERVPVVMHSAAMGGSEWIPKKGGKEGEKEVEKLIVIDREQGKPVNLVEKEERYYPGLKNFEKGRVMDPESKLANQNASKWDNELNQVFFNKDRVDEIIEKQGPHIQKAMKILQNTPKEKIDWVLENREEVKQGYKALENAQTYLDDLQQQLTSNFDKAWKFCDSEEDKKELRKLSERYGEKVKKLKENPGDLKLQSEAIQQMIDGLKEVTPRQFVRVEDFALDKSATTFGNVALNAYKKYGKKAPMINIENMYTGMAFSGNMDDMNNLIMESKKKFVNRATKPKNKGGLGLSEDKAKKAADDVIGMTFDLGHLNISKKKGFSDKDLIGESKKISKHVKHVHMADNFGYSDSHLPPGMGNVPNKELLEELEKQGKTKEMRKIVEAGGFVQHFGTSPHPYTLEGMGSPIYEEGEPYWNQSMGFQQGYSSGHGQMLPPGHFENYGIPSFSNLPQELGGQRMGAGGSRFSGNQME
ncbi:MAG TPA: TIM barrel protein [Candidatus Nanoarchaeia archaeon]|nr:TIM barrel protein [Candidatus Nanoarchaeia archaeon]